MSFDNLVHTAPFPDFTKADMNIKPPLGLTTPNMLRFTKKLGLHRGNPRCFFETTDIQPFGFVPGAKYTTTRTHGPVLTLCVDPQGQRAVCKKVKGARTLSVIDINSAIYMAGFKDEKEVLVTVSNNLISIEKLPKE